MDNVLDILLSRAPVSPVQEKQVKIKRLSPKDGDPVIFTLRSIGYSRAAEIMRMDGIDTALMILLEGVKEPDLKNQALLDHYDAATPLELLKKMLLPGEIGDLQYQIETLSGYRRSTLEEVKKK